MLDSGFQKKGDLKLPKSLSCSSEAMFEDTSGAVQSVHLFSGATVPTVPPGQVLELSHDVSPGGKSSGGSTVEKFSLCQDFRGFTTSSRSLRTASACPTISSKPSPASVARCAVRRGVGVMALRAFLEASQLGLEEFGEVNKWH